MTEEDIKKIEESDKKKDEFVFIRQEIKSRPINRKKLARNTIFAAISAVVFGIVACVTFALIAPFLMDRLSPRAEEPEVNVPVLITFPEETEEEEMSPEDMLLTESEIEEVEEIDFSAYAALEEEQIRELLSSVKFTLNDYAEIYVSMAGIANKAKRSLVRVTPVKKGSDWLDLMYENTSELTGLLLADSGTETFIATRYSAIKGNNDIVVTFSNGFQAVAEMISYDTDTDLCVLSVSDDNLKDINEGAIEFPVLGASFYSNLVGSPIIAVGSPMGTYGSINYGIVTSNTERIQATDYNYKQVVTNIYGSLEASGVLINLRGEVVGIIDTKYPYSGTQNIVCAIGISELKRTLERLMNRTELAMLGIQGSDVPNEAIFTGTPDGVFVLSVEFDSPAMAAGIQSGDIISAIGDAPFSRFSDFVTALNSIEIGSEKTITIYRSVQDTYKKIDIDVLFNKENK